MINAVGQVRDLGVTINGELSMDQQHARNVVRAPTSSGNLCTAVVPDDNRRSTYSDCMQPIRCEFANCDPG